MNSWMRWYRPQNVVFTFRCGPAGENRHCSQRQFDPIDRRSDRTIGGIGDGIQADGIELSCTVPLGVGKWADAEWRQTGRAETPRHLGLRSELPSAEYIGKVKPLWVDFLAAFGIRTCRHVHTAWRKDCFGDAHMYRRTQSNPSMSRMGHAPMEEVLSQRILVARTIRQRLHKTLNTAQIRDRGP